MNFTNKNKISQKKEKFEVKLELIGININKEIVFQSPATAPKTCWLECAAINYTHNSHASAHGHK